MLTLKTYSPWNGYSTLADAKESGALYTIAEYDDDRSSYTTIHDMMDACRIVAERMIGVDPIQFVVERDGQPIELESLLD